MTQTVMKGVAATLSALALSVSLMASPASAQTVHPGGGYHGGGYHGGYHGGGGYWRGGRWFGPAVGLGILGGIAAGAIVANSYYGGPYYGDAPAYAYGPGPSCTGFRPVYDRYGNVVGQRPVNIC